MAARPTIIWQIHDEKPGHRNQLRGLTDALAELLPTEVHTIRAPRRRTGLAGFFSRSFAPGRDLPPPDLILGAGHSTHLAMLAARRTYGGKTVVLMKPSLPPKLFDLCLVPEHDGMASSDRVVTTRGVLNVIRPSQAHKPKHGLLLIGGPSASHDWSDQQMVAQVATIAESDPSVRWQLTSSRRTPGSFLSLLRQHELPNLQAVPHDETHSGWVSEQLAVASQVWVSEDSVSMVYEALTSGAAVGVLQVPCKREGRVAAGMQQLIEAGWATRFANWRPGARLATPPQQLDEARRCAEIVSRRLLATPSNSRAG